MDYPEHLNFQVEDQVKVFDPEYKKWNYFKFCKLVAHSFVDNIENKSYQAWQYSLTSNSKENPNPSA